MKKYKTILNLNSQNEKIYYFNTLRSCIKKIKDNYIIMYYDKKLSCYTLFDYKLNYKQQRCYYRNIGFYAC